MSQVSCITGAASAGKEHVIHVRAAIRISSHRGPAMLPFREEDGGGARSGRAGNHAWCGPSLATDHSSQRLDFMSGKDVCRRVQKHFVHDVMRNHLSVGAGISLWQTHTSHKTPPNGLVSTREQLQRRRKGEEGQRGL